jgi:hypothetical protein
LAVILLLAGSAGACTTEPETTIHISVEPARISLSAREGQNPRGQPLEIYSSAEIDPLIWEARKPLMWQAKDDTLWLEVSPSWGTFDSGVSKAVVFTETSGMSAGYYSATISIFVQEADKRQTDLLKRIDTGVRLWPTLVKGDLLTPPGQAAAKEAMSEQSRIEAQKRLDEDTKTVGFVRGEVYQLEDGTWAIHWGGKYPL